MAIFADNWKESIILQFWLESKVCEDVRSINVLQICEKILERVVNEHLGNGFT